MPVNALQLCLQIEKLCSRFHSKKNWTFLGKRPFCFSRPLGA